MIAVDWGTSSLRAYRLDGDGAVRERRRADIGALSCAGRHAETLAAQLEGWDDERIVLCGTIGTRGAWQEVPYLECPVSPAALAAGLARVASDHPAWRGRTVHIVPGVIDRGSSDVPDVMRGEETQIVGLMQGRELDAGTVCLPGTHSKWVRVQAGAIVSVRTAMTGEVYALLRGHSILARLMDPGEAPFDAAAFDAGLRRSRDAGGLLHHLFGVRTLGLTGSLPAAASPWYLSGLLIGHEVQAQAEAARRVLLVAGDRLAAAYGRAFAAFGIEAETHPEDLAAAGLYALARMAAQ